MSQGTTAHSFENPERSHPDAAKLECFLRGELEKVEVRRVVRHLLTRCPECAAVVRPLWGSSPR
jgi:hypothetical protein